MKKNFAVIGLGHFGLNLSLSLTNLGAEVLAIDNKEQNVEKVRDRVSHAVIADARDQGALRSLGLEDMDAVIVAIGEDFESSMLATANLQEIGVKRIVNRVVSPIHEKLLRLMKVDDLILPEGDAARELANKLVRKGLLEYLALSKDYSIMEIHAPKEFVGASLAELDLRKHYDVNLITVIKKGHKAARLPFAGDVGDIQVLGVPDGSYRFEEHDILVVFGSEASLKSLLVRG